MAKNAAKKRRSGARKVSRKQKNTFRYKKPEITSAVVREMWDNNLTAEANMAKMGIRQSANRGIRPVASQAAAKATPGRRLVEADEVSRLFDVADTSDLTVIDRNYGRRPMSDEDQRYTARLMAKHGLDHEAMARDIKVNYNQLTLGQLRRMCETLLSLGEDQRVVSKPECVSNEATKAAPIADVAAAAAGNGVDGNSETSASSASMAMDVGDESDDGGVAQKKPKKKKSKRTKSNRSGEQV